ncbi:hypothetical protein EG856_02860 [Mycoplasmopsis phocirhinis]|uniref:site-specific DNA-methyltransferase (adenine-specific) n=1 Tax=Mycoplasmopsis phocirhinis TaxID=142650 RepID=A0A4P6MRY7_9BACT|nr:N-6 DNA methylase [Mycoplasmopsis phocirhinis]QBF34839.1 hypothetical protein EG856_02860 [Mycoplasmopsis phocirhinis]
MEFYLGGGSEAKIRQKLIENGYIDTIIGLPAGIFFRTGIATIIMVLRKNRINRDIQFIDASKLFTKDSSTNRMEASHIRKIVDTYINKLDVEKFAKVVSYEQIKENDFNLNISRYIDSFEKEDFHDLYASLHGGIPNSEINKFKLLWDSMPNLKQSLIKPIDNQYSDFIDKNNIYQNIIEHNDTKIYLQKYTDIVNNLNEFLSSKLTNLQSIKNINIENLADEFDNFFFNHAAEIKIVDKYDLYQQAINIFKTIKNDLYAILANIEQKNNSYDNVLDNDFIGKKYFTDEWNQISALKADIEEKTSRIKEIEPDKKAKDTLTEEEQNELKQLQSEEKALKTNLKTLERNFDDKKASKISTLNETQFIELLHMKWSEALSKSILDKGNDIVNNEIAKLEKLAQKYDVTLSQINDQIKDNENELIQMLKELEGDEYDMKGINELINLLGKNNEK